MKHTVAFSLLSLLIFSSCTSQQQKEKYASYFKNTWQEQYLNGPVKMQRQVCDFYKPWETIPKDSLQMFKAGFSVLPVGDFGYREFDSLGITTKFHPLIGRLNLSVPYDSAVVKHKEGNIYVYIEKYFKDDVTKKVEYRQQFPIKKHVFNPYRVHLNYYSYQPYHFYVKKDSTAKMITKAYRYELNSKGAIKQEIGVTLWDRNLDDTIEEEKVRYKANYNYNEKNQLISKNYSELARVPYFPDHDAEFYDTGYKTDFEAYTYDERGNLTSFRLYTDEDKSKRRIVAKEEYKYNEQNNLIWKRKWATFVYGNHFKLINDLEFNEKGEVAKVTTFENDGKTVHLWYRFEYFGYDEYDNWTGFFVYLKDSKEPFAEVNRIIEYYKEEKE